jgi:hypothetical protein
MMMMMMMMMQYDAIMQSENQPWPWILLFHNNQPFVVV